MEVVKSEVFGDRMLVRAGLLEIELILFIRFGAHFVKIRGGRNGVVIVCFEALRAGTTHEVGTIFTNRKGENDGCAKYLAELLDSELDKMRLSLRKRNRWADTPGRRG